MFILYMSRKSFPALKLLIQCRPVARNFGGGEGEGAYLKNRDQIVYVGMIRHANFEGTRAQTPTYR